MKTGEVVGFEALARLAVGEALRPPAAFLHQLSTQGLADLFVTMLGQALSMLRAVSNPSFQPYVSINIEPSVLVIDGFILRVRDELDRHGYAGGGRLVVELLEGDQILDFTVVSHNLQMIRSMGMRVALDDIGSAYSSLAHLRELPVDFIKLDQSFVRRLGERPEDLHFTLSLQALANGLAACRTEASLRDGDCGERLLPPAWLDVRLEASGGARCVLVTGSFEVRQRGKRVAQAAA